MTNTKLNLGIVFGGRSGEHAVSLRPNLSGDQSWTRLNTRFSKLALRKKVLGSRVPMPYKLSKRASRESLHEALLLNTAGEVSLFSRQGEKLKLISLLDVVFPVLHGTFGEDGTIQGH